MEKNLNIIRTKKTLKIEDYITQLPNSDAYRDLSMLERAACIRALCTTHRKRTKQLQKVLFELERPVIMQFPINLEFKFDAVYGELDISLCGDLKVNREESVKLLKAKKREELKAIKGEIRSFIKEVLVSLEPKALKANIDTCNSIMGIFYTSSI